MYNRVVNFLVLALLLVSCQAEPITVESTVEVPVTVEITSEVTRVVETQVTAEVTRLVEVTRIVQVTPRPEDTPVPSPTPEVLASAVNFLVSNFDLSQLPVAEEGSFVVVASGQINRFNVMPIIAHNNTNRVLLDTTGSVIVRAADGSLLGTGSIDTMFPVYIQPGGWIMGEIQFKESMPSDAGYEISLVYEESPYDTIFKELEIIDHNVLGRRLVGFLFNSTGLTIGNSAVVVMCLDESLTPLSYEKSYIDQETISNGQQAAFDVELEGSCPLYMVSARGYEPRN